MTKPYRIVLLTSDKYIKAVLPYAWLMKRYWPGHPEVLVAGFTEPDFKMPERFTFHSIGKFSDYPVNRWSDALIKLMYEIPDEVFVLMLEDYWINQTVNGPVVQMCVDYCNQFEYVARLDLTSDRRWANGGNVSLYGKMGHVDLIWSDPNSQYHCSLMTGVWQKKHLLKVAIPGETPWQFELQGTPRLSAMRNEMIVLGTNFHPVHHTLAFRGGDTQKLLLDGLDDGDVQEMGRLTLLDTWL